MWWCDMRRSSLHLGHTSVRIAMMMVARSQVHKHVKSNSRRQAVNGSIQYLPHSSEAHETQGRAITSAAQETTAQLWVLREVGHAVKRREGTSLASARRGLTRHSAPQGRIQRSGAGYRLSAIGYRLSGVPAFQRSGCRAMAWLAVGRWRW